MAGPAERLTWVLASCTGRNAGLLLIWSQPAPNVFRTCFFEAVDGSKALGIAAASALTGSVEEEMGVLF